MQLEDVPLLSYDLIWIETIRDIT